MLVRFRKRHADGRATAKRDLLGMRIMRLAKMNVRVNRDILMEVSSYLDICTLNDWRKTSAEVDAAVAHHLNHEFNKMLLAWFANPDGFRAMMRVTDSVISGSASLRFLQRHTPVDWKANDLDIYTPFTSALRLILYLTAVERYKIDNVNPPSYHEDSKGFHRVFHLCKNGRSIDVIQSVTPSALHPLPFFWGSHVITFLSADVYCLPYPRLTIQRKSVLNPMGLSSFNEPSPRTQACMEKYKERGFSIRRSHMDWDDLPECDQTHEACSRLPRYFGDEHCVLGSFIPNSTPVLPCRSRCMPVWWRGGRPCDKSCADADQYNRFATATVETMRAHDAVRVAKQR